MDIRGLCLSTKYGSACSVFDILEDAIRTKQQVIVDTFVGMLTRSAWRAKVDTDFARGFREISNMLSLNDLWVIFRSM